MVEDLKELQIDHKRVLLCGALIGGREPQHGVRWFCYIAATALKMNGVKIQRESKKQSPFFMMFDLHALTNPTQILRCNRIQTHVTAALVMAFQESTSSFIGLMNTVGGAEEGQKKFYVL